MAPMTYNTVNMMNITCMMHMTIRNWKTLITFILAKNGHLEVLKWLHENSNEGCTADAMNEAAKNGHLDVVKWLYYNRVEGNTTKALDLAREFNQGKVIEFLTSLVFSLTFFFFVEKKKSKRKNQDN